METVICHINLKNLTDNYLRICELYKGKEVIAVVKDDAYNHGLINVTRALMNQGCKFFAVGSIEEAIYLRSIFENIKIMTVGVSYIEDFDLYYNNDIILNVWDSSMCETLLKYDKSLIIHFKVNTGMNRLGLTKEEIKKYLHPLLDKHYIEGIYTHLGNASKELYQEEIKIFKDILNELDYSFKVIHVNNSYGMLNHEKELQFTTHIRPGIALYGYYGFKPTFNLSAKIISIRKVKKGERIGYNLEKVKSDIIIGIINIGYGQGILKSNINREVRINNKKYPLVGSICMDMSFVQIDENVKINDDVFLFDDYYQAEKHLNTITYEIFCNISKNIKKLYY